MGLNAAGINKRVLRQILNGTSKNFVHLNFIDIGAHKGEFTKLCSRVFPGANILAVEPQPELASRIKALDLPNVKVISAAVGTDSHSTSGAIARNMVGDSKAHLKSPGELGPFDFLVEVIRLEELIAQQQMNSICLLKIDAEGWNFDILKSSKALL